MRRQAAVLCFFAMYGSAFALPQQSSPIAVSDDEIVLVNVNPDADTISIFGALTTTPVKTAEILVGDEPRSVALRLSTGKAYVANARAGTVSVVTNLTTTPAVAGQIAVGAEPMAVALSPNGTRLYVANSASNTLSVVDTTTDSILATVDLSSIGTAPRAISITDDGDADDTDETVFVALFYGQLRSGKTATQEGEDDQREGRVAAVSAATNALGSPSAAVLGPIASAGFNSNGQLAPASAPTPNPTPNVASTNPQSFTTPTGCFPNQLASLAIQPTAVRAYVVSTCASPNGPLRFNHMVQGAVSVFDTATRTEITAGQTSGVRQTAPLNLNQGVNLATTPAPRLFLSNPVAIAWRPDGSDAWVAIQNTDVVVRMTVDGSGIPTVGAPLVAGSSQIVRVDLLDEPPATLADAPRGVTILPSGNRLFVSNFVSRSVSVVDITNPTAPSIVARVSSTPLPPIGSIDEEALRGAALFYTGRGPQERMSSESWGGCITCHPDGRADNVTWMFDAGPRQTIPLDGMFDKANPTDQRILNWSAVRDENHDFELNTRGVFGGRGLIDDDRLFLAIGGTSGAGPSDQTTVEQFQQVTGATGTTNDLTGTPLPQLPSARRDFAIATLGDDRVFLIGGRSGAGQGNLLTSSDAVLELDPRTNTLTPISTSGFTPRHSLGAAAVKTSAGPRIYAVGGYASTVSTASPVNTVQELDPDTGVWRTVATLPTAVAQFGITVAGGLNTADPRQLIHVVSGNAGSESAPSLAPAAVSVQRFDADPAGPGTWTSFNVSGLTARRNHGAATAIRGVAARIFVIGGQDAAGTVLDTVEEYTNLATPALVATPHTSLPAPRAQFGIGSSLSTNQIYVVGGVDGTGVDQTSVLEYTIANNGPVAGPAGTPSGSWVTRANVSVARRGLVLSTPPGVTNFLPVASSGRNALQDSIETWIARNVRTARAPVSAANPAATAGRALFGQSGLVVSGFSCATCHGGPKWTRSTVDYPPPPSPDNNLGLGAERVVGAELRTTFGLPDVLVNVGTFAQNSAGGRTNEVRFNGADISQAITPLGANGFNVPSLLSAHETAPYYYSGLAQTLEEVLNGSQDGNGGVRHHFVTSATDRANLIAFLRSIDDATADFDTAGNTPTPTNTPAPTNTPLPTSTPTQVICQGQTATIIGTSGNDTLIGTDGADVIVGLEGDDVITAGRGRDTVCGGPGNDEIEGQQGGDLLVGNEGDDMLFGRRGADELSGREGDDQLIGGGGNDTLRGGMGVDSCDGGAGTNTVDGCE